METESRNSKRIPPGFENRGGGGVRTLNKFLIEGQREDMGVGWGRGIMVLDSYDPL